MGDGCYQGQVRTVTGLGGQLAATREGDGERGEGGGGWGVSLRTGYSYWSTDLPPPTTPLLVRGPPAFSGELFNI